MDIAPPVTPELVAARSPFPHRQPIGLRLEKPVLCVIVDAEEDFLWEGPFTSTNNSTTSIGAQQKTHVMFAHYGIKPTYLVTYPLAVRGQCDRRAARLPGRRSVRDRGATASLGDAAVRLQVRNRDAVLPRQSAGRDRAREVWHA